jgi:hypothetical protein
MSAFEVEGDLESKIENLLTTQRDINGAIEFLTGNGWPRGLTEHFVKSSRRMQIRFFLCDDSDSVRDFLTLMLKLVTFLMHNCLDGKH